MLKGGRSLERAVSLRSGAQVQDALERLRHEVAVIDVGDDLVPMLKEAAPDVAFIALHGRDGEDGTVQELLEALDIPYTGSGPSGCMRCTDKALAKHLLREAGLPTPDFYAFKERSIKEWDVASALPDVARKLGFPMVVKPASQGSALGVKFARSSEELPGAILGALSYDRKVVLERYVPGRDLAVSVLEAPPSTRRRRAAGARGAPGGRGGADRKGLLRLRGALRDRAHALRLPRGAAGVARGAREGARPRQLPRARLRRRGAR